MRNDRIELEQIKVILCFFLSSFHKNMAEFAVKLLFPLQIYDLF